MTKKNIIYLLLFNLAFFFIQEIASQLRLAALGEPVFAWVHNTKTVAIVISNLVVFFLYTLAAFCLFTFFYRKNRYKAILFILLGALAIIGVRYLIQELIFPALLGFENYEDETYLFYLANNIYYSVIYSSFGVLYFFVLNERRRITEESQLLLANKNAQLAFLQAQINPHFLFNNLNNIYSMVYAKAPQSLDAIAGLSEIIRYMIYENKDMVSLDKEIRYIRKYIELQAFRFPRIRIDQRYEGDFSDISIPKLLLISFVENAFKHGDLKHAGNHIELLTVCENNYLKFYLKNRIKKLWHHEQQSGIGLTNIKKRLQLLFPDKHQLYIEEKQGNFTVELKINLC